MKYRALNSIIQVPIFSMKDKHDIMYTAGISKQLPPIDLLGRYCQINMADECKLLKAFTKHHGTYRWRTMSFGLSWAAAKFQKEINSVLQAQRNYVQAYIDDVIVFSDSWEKPCNHVRAAVEDLNTISTTFKRHL